MVDSNAWNMLPLLTELPAAICLSSSTETSFRSLANSHLVERQ